MHIYKKLDTFQPSQLFKILGQVLSNFLGSWTCNAPKSASQAAGIAHLCHHTQRRSVFYQYICIILSIWHALKALRVLVLVLIVTPAFIQASIQDIFSYYSDMSNTPFWDTFITLSNLAFPCTSYYKTFCVWALISFSSSKHKLHEGRGFFVTSRVKQVSGP